MNDRKIVNVSVITANYNQGAFLEGYFESLLASSVLPAEIILVDDGSSDSSLDIISAYRKFPLNLKVLSFKPNRGFVPALNEAIDHVKSAFIMRLDPDDFIFPRKVELQYDFLMNSEVIDLLGTNTVYYNATATKSIFQTNFPTSHDEIGSYLINGEIPLLHSSVMGKAEVFKKYYYKEHAYPSEDYDFFVRAYKGGAKFANLKTPLMGYRIHNGNLSDKYLWEVNEKIFIIRDRYFNKNSIKYTRLMNFFHLKNYRKFLNSDKHIKGFLYLFLSALANPKKVWRRFQSLVNL